MIAEGVVPGRTWYSRPVLDVAPELLGAHLSVRSPEGTVTVRLTEVEAYGGSDDPASHAYRRRTPRNQTMFGPAGRLYIYFTYGMHHCCNVVAGQDGVAAAVLLRAGEVVEGLEVARRRRPTARSDAELARGPGRLTTALGLTGADDAVSLDGLGGHGSPRAALLLPRAPAGPAERGPRTGIAFDQSQGAVLPWRFWLSGEATVSPYRPGARRSPRGAGVGSRISGTAD